MMVIKPRIVVNKAQRISEGSQMIRDLQTETPELFEKVEKYFTFGPEIIGIG